MTSQLIPAPALAGPKAKRRRASAQLKAARQRADELQAASLALLETLDRELATLQANVTTYAANVDAAVRAYGRAVGVPIDDGEDDAPAIARA